MIDIVQRYCAKCKSLIPANEDTCPICRNELYRKPNNTKETNNANTNNTMKGMPKNHSSNTGNTKRFIGLFLIITILIVGIQQFNSIKVKMEFKSALESYLNNEILKDVKYYKSYTLSGDYYNILNLVFNNDFDSLFPKEQYNILHDIMQKFENKRNFFSHQYKLSDEIIKQGISGLPNIFVYTLNDSNKKYEYSSVDSFTDKNGELYLDFEMSDNKPTYDSNDQDIIYESISGSDNGYKWNKTSYDAQVNLCKDISSRIGGHDWNYYYDAINEFYNSNDANILNTKIAEVAGMVSVIR